jgi:hypothetical protein
MGELVYSLRLEWNPSIDEDSEELKDRNYNPERSELAYFYQVAIGYGLDAGACESVKAGSENAIASILLCSLPNLVSMDIILPGNDKIIEGLRTKLDTRSLGKVESVWISSQHDGDGGYPLETLLPFLTLPSIRSITATMVYAEARRGLQRRDLEAYLGTSFLERIEFRYTNIEASILSDLLKIPRSLKYFAYHRSIQMGSSNSCREDFSEALLSVADTLEDLSIEWDEYSVDLEEEEDDDSVFGWIVELKVLKRLTIPLHDIVGRNPSGALPLVEVLPPNLEELSISGAHDIWVSADYIRIIRLLLRAKRDQLDTLTKLRRISIHDGILEPLIKFGVELGVEIT